MFVMIDNYDSFVYNLATYMKELDCPVQVVRNDQIEIEVLDTLIDERKLKGILISPGPKSPKDCGMSGKIIRYFVGKLPILGVCLGHQIIAHEFGAAVEKGQMPMHGKISPIAHNGNGIFENIPSPYNVTRYHSLVVKDQNLPDCLQVNARVNARTEDGVIMAINHREFPLYGVQFHPEALLTEHGHKLLENFIKISEGWWEHNEDNC